MQILSRGSWTVSAKLRLGHLLAEVEGGGSVSATSEPWSWWRIWRGAWDWELFSRGLSGLLGSVSGKEPWALKDQGSWEGASGS